MKYLSFFYLFAICVLIGIISCDKIAENNVVVDKHEHLNNGEECATPMPTRSELQARERAAINYTTIDPNQPVCINIFFHIVRNNDGSGGYPSANVGIIIDSLNSHYNRHGIYFNSVGHDFINNTAFNSIDNENEAEQLGNVNVKQNAIDYYIVNNLWNTDRGFIAGTALSIPSKRLVIRRDRVTTSTSSHEVGHCLDLLHTHQGTEPGTSGCAENINGSNCSSCGDEICDTPADDREGNANGYSPDFYNLMSYYAPRIRFTQGQASRMKTSIFNNSVLLKVIGQNCIIPAMTVSKTTYCSDENIVYTLHNGGTNVTWNISPNVNIISQSNNSIVVKPQTTYEKTAFVEAVLPFQTIRKEVWIGTPLVALTMYCNDIFSTTCDLNSGGASGSLPFGSKVDLSLIGGGTNSTAINDWEWEKGSGNFIFTTGNYTTNPINNGNGSLGKTATIQINGSGTIQIKVRAKNGCGWGNWKYIMYSVTM